MGSEKKQEREGAELRPSEGRSKGRRETVQEARIRAWMEGVKDQASFSLAAHLLTLQALYQPPYSA